MALSLAGSPERLGALRKSSPRTVDQFLVRTWPVSPVHIEAAYEIIWRRHCDGLALPPRREKWRPSAGHAAGRSI